MSVDDKLQHELERDLRIEGIRSWAASHKVPLVIITLMVVSFAIGSIVALVSGGTADKSEGDSPVTANVAATFDGVSITEDEVSAYVAQYRAYAGYLTDEQWATYMDGMAMDAKDVRQDAIRTLVRKVAVKRRAEELGIAATDAEIDDRLALEMDKMGHRDDWDTYVTKTLMYPSADGYRADIEMMVILDKLLDVEIEPIEPTDLEIMSQATSSDASYTGVRSYDALFVAGEDADASDVGDALSHARDLVNRLKESSDGDGKVDAEKFMSAVSDIGGASGNKARDMGWSCLSDMTAAYYDAVTPLGAGEFTTEPFRDAEGWHVAWVAEEFRTRPDTVTSLHAMPEEIYQALRTDAYKRMLTNAYAEYADSLVDKGHLEIIAMPSGLAYDVDMGFSLLRKSGDDQGDEASTQPSIEMTLGTDEGE